jgi:hypothetical protein
LIHNGLELPQELGTFGVELEVVTVLVAPDELLAVQPGLGLEFRGVDLRRPVGC